MRNIKFRAWVDNKQGMFPNLTDLGSWIQKGHKVMQFTGFLDKDKKEIYDGDLIEYYIGGKDFFTELYQLSYSEERGCWQINIVKKCNHINSPQFIAQHLTQTYASCMKVVGNIHENKDALVSGDVE